MGKKRKQPDTSQAALDAKSSDSMNKDYDKIISALRVIGSGNYDDIAKAMQVQDANVVSRRMKEMREMKLIVNTGNKTLTRRGRMAYVHCLANESQPKTEAEVAYKKSEPSAADHAKKIIKITKQEKPSLVQRELF